MLTIMVLVVDKWHVGTRGKQVSTEAEYSYANTHRPKFLIQLDSKRNFHGEISRLLCLEIHFDGFKKSNY